MKQKIQRKYLILFIFVYVKACNELCDWIINVKKAVAGALTGKNYDRFAEIFGNEIYRYV